MAFARKNHPFFSDFNVEANRINEDIEAALHELISRDHVFYKKTLFSAFLGYTKKETDIMSLQEYIDCSIVIDNVLKLWHAPFQKHD